jgi:hypothetical protein
MYWHVYIVHYVCSIEYVYDVEYVCSAEYVYDVEYVCSVEYVCIAEYICSVEYVFIVDYVCVDACINRVVSNITADTSGVDIVLVSTAWLIVVISGSLRWACGRKEAI